MQTISKAAATHDFKLALARCQRNTERTSDIPPEVEDSQTITEIVDLDDRKWLENIALVDENIVNDGPWECMEPYEDTKIDRYGNETCSKFWDCWVGKFPVKEVLS